MRMPESKDFDTADFCVDLVVELIASAAEKKTANALLLGVTSTRADPRLGRDELEGSLDVFDESERGCRTIRTPPHGSSPDLARSAGCQLDGESARDQGLRAKFPEERFRIDELPLRCLLEGLFEGSLFVGRELEALVGLGNEDSHGGSLF